MFTKKLLTILAVVMILGVCSVQAVNVDFYSDAIIRPGEVYDIVSVYDTLSVPTVVHMFGGSIKSVHSYDSSTFNIHEGEISRGIYSVDSSSVNIHGGTISLDSLIVSNSSILNLYGGNFLCGNSPYFSESSTVNIYGYDFNYDGFNLIGFLSDDSSFLIREVSFSDYSHINLIVIPEPATVLLLGLGGLFLRRRS